MRVTPIRTEIIILATRTQNVLGEKGRRIRELTSVVQKRFGFPEGTVEVLVEILESNSNSVIKEGLEESCTLILHFISTFKLIFILLVCNITVDSIGGTL